MEAVSSGQMETAKGVTHNLRRFDSTTIVSIVFPGCGPRSWITGHFKYRLSPYLLLTLLENRGLNAVIDVSTNPIFTSTKGFGGYAASSCLFSRVRTSSNTRSNSFLIMS